MNEDKAAAKEPEPSMEEILSSIRKIIASDEEEGPPAKAEEPSGGDEEEVLELTEVVVEEEAEEAPQTPKDAEEDVTAKVQKQDDVADSGETAAEAPDLAELEKKVEEELAKEEIELVGGEKQEAEPAAAGETATEGLLSPETAAAATGAFAKLAKSVARPEPEVPPTLGGRTIEAFLADLVRPMLKEWLDAHLPAIVERVVEQEVKKLARRAELL